MAAGLHQLLQRIFKDTFVLEVVDAFVLQSRELKGTDGGGRVPLAGPDIVCILDHLGFLIGTGKEGRTREQKVCQLLSYGGVQRNCADQYSLCTEFGVQQADCIRTWAGLARNATA